MAAGWTAAARSASVASVMVRSLNADGSFASGSARIATAELGADRTVAMAATADGGFTVAFSAAPAGRDPVVQFRRFDATGSALTRAVEVGPATRRAETEPSIAAFPGGGFVVAWTAETAGSSVIGYQRFRGDGTAADDPQTIAQPAATTLFKPAVVTRTDTAFDVIFGTDGAAGDILRSSFLLGAAAP